MKRLLLITVGCLLALSFAFSTCWADTPKASPQDADFELSGASWQGPFRVTSMMTVYSNGTWYWRAYLNNGRTLLDSFGNHCDQALLLTAFMKDADLWVYMDDKSWGNVSLNRAP